MSSRTVPRSLDPPAPAVPIVRYEEFLVPQELRGLLAHALGHAGRFVSSQVTRDGGRGATDGTQRRSRVLFDLGPFAALFDARLRFFLPHTLFTLERPPFPVATIELQLTASNNGEFFRPHTDTGDGTLGKRELTFVYFFHREPRRFTGGALRIFADTVDGRGTRPFELIYPNQNEIVFFPSGLLHEILPVACPSQAFADSRFTVNGWIRR